MLGVAGEAGLITPLLSQRFIGASVVTLLISPFLIRYAPAISGWVSERLNHPGARLPDPAHDTDRSQNRLRWSYSTKMT